MNSPTVNETIEELKDQSIKIMSSLKGLLNS